MASSVPMNLASADSNCLREGKGEVGDTDARITVSTGYGSSAGQGKVRLAMLCPLFHVADACVHQTCTDEGVVMESVCQPALYDTTV